MNVFILFFALFWPVIIANNFLSQLGVVVTKPINNIHLYDIKSDVKITFSFPAPIIKLPPLYKDCANESIYKIYNKFNNDITSEILSVFDFIKHTIAQERGFSRKPRQLFAGLSIALGIESLLYAYRTKEKVTEIDHIKHAINSLTQHINLLGDQLCTLSEYQLQHYLLNLKQSNMIAFNNNLQSVVADLLHLSDRSLNVHKAMVSACITVNPNLLKPCALIIQGGHFNLNWLSVNYNYTNNQGEINVLLEIPNISATLTATRIFNYGVLIESDNQILRKKVSLPKQFVNYIAIDSSDCIKLSKMDTLCLNSQFNKASNFDQKCFSSLLNSVKAPGGNNIFNCSFSITKSWSGCEIISVESTLAINSAYNSTWFQDGQINRFSKNKIDMVPGFHILPNKAGSVICNKNVHSTFETDLTSRFRPISNLTINVVSNQYEVGSDPNVLKRLPLLPLMTNDYNVHSHIMVLTIISIIFILLAFMVFYYLAKKKCQICLVDGESTAV